MKFYQILTFVNEMSTTPSGVLNFRPIDISYFYTPRESKHAQLLIKGSAVYYTVLYEDLKRIMERVNAVGN